jgi:hypothetical protein
MDHARQEEDSSSASDALKAALMGDLEQAKTLATRMLEHLNERSRSEAGRRLSLDISLSSRLLNLDVGSSCGLSTGTQSDVSETIGISSGLPLELSSPTN